MREIEKGSWREEKWQGREKGRWGLTSFWIWKWIGKKIAKSNKLKSLLEYCPMSSHYPMPLSPYNPIVTWIHSISLPTAVFCFLFFNERVKSHLWPFVILLNLEGNLNREWRFFLPPSSDFWLSVFFLPLPSPITYSDAGILYTTLLLKVLALWAFNTHNRYFLGSWIYFPEA